uniref:Phosphatidate cytidylyltransferase n=1 Tax=Caenorhabditis tropicalis TaxID=1561998 RepID=A0A1I7SY04_9PELO
MSDQPSAENADIRQRRVPDSPESLKAPERDDVRPTSDESDMDAVLQDEDRMERLTRAIPQDKGSLGEFADSMLEALPPRWRNWVVRGLFTIIMISTFTFIVNRGATWLMFLNFLHFLVAYHRLVSFALYCIGFVSFVLSLRKGYYMRQFSLFAWTHLTLLLIVSQSFFIIQNIFQGLIWFLAPVAMIICCDVMSYMFGFFWGKTPLIKLSPKKTWEGFIGGAFSTVIFGILLSLALYNRPFFVCPVQHYQTDSSNCTIPLAFQLQDYPVPRPFSFFFKILRKEPVIQLFPFVFHSIALSLFASILGPFGGFFASGFKRAFKIKDFGDVIPGHGGLMDRFDCQLLMGTFVMVYIHSFIRVPDASKLVKQIMTLEPLEQLDIYNLLQNELSKNGLL